MHNNSTVNNFTNILIHAGHTPFIQTKIYHTFKSYMISLFVIYQTDIHKAFSCQIFTKTLTLKTKYLVMFHGLKQVLSSDQLIQIYYGLFTSIAVYEIIGLGGL